MVVRVSEALCKYRGLAPWVGMVLTVVIQIAAIAYSYGMLSQRQADFDHRLTIIESSDREQSRQIGESAARLARIEEGVAYIRDAVRSERGR